MMAGALGEGTQLRWPPQHNAEGDEGSATLLVAALGLDERGWSDAESLTADVLALPDVRRVSRLLTYELRTHDRLDAARIVELWHEAQHDDETCALGRGPELTAVRSEWPRAPGEVTRVPGSSDGVGGRRGSRIPHVCPPRRPLAS